MSEKEIIEQSKEDRRKKAELELLLGDDKDEDDEVVVKSKKRDRKEKGDLDSRFAGQLDGDNDFAIDPTHKEYRKVVQGHNKIAKRPKKY